MASQRFCLRWNNHQSNLLSVFDQLLHAETFTDVTLAVEGQYLKAHKMVLSACSPYFQALFVNHPEKHPIVILKDITYADMKSLLDFMYRGEVSVDQERLTAFLRVAESLRIKGLTEVNDDKPASNNNNSSNSNNNNTNNNNSNTNSAEQTQTPPPQLHRIQPYLMQQQRKAQGMMLSNPLLGSALTMPKRKRGRPRKLSGCSNGTADDFNDYESRDNLVQGSPELLEMKVNADIYPESSDDNGDDDEDSNEQMDTSEPLNKSQLAASSSKDSSIRKDIDNSGSEITPTNYSNYMRYGLMVPKSESSPQPSPMKIRINPLTQTPSTSNLANALQQLHNDSINNNAPNRSTMPSTNPITPNSVSTSSVNTMVTNYLSNQLSNPTQPTVPADVKPVITPTGTRPPQRRRVRRKANSPADDQAEHLTEMSVRGLNLFRYATIYEGIYQCTECAKENIQKTFKNKYSFQRHAFLYHEGTQRKVFPCPVCSKEFSRPDKMKNHMKMTHEAFMPKVEVYPLSYLMGGGGDMPQMASPGVQQPTNQQQQKKLQQQLQNSQMKDNVSQQIQSILNSQVENMVVTPQIQHLLNSQRMGDSASGTSTPSPTLTNHQQQQQQQQQLLQKLQQQLTNQQTSTQNPTSTQSQSPQASPSQLRIVSAQSLNDTAEDTLTPTTIRHDDDVICRSNEKNDDVMSQFNAQILNMQQIKVENVGPSSD